MREFTLGMNAEKTNNIEKYFKQKLHWIKFYTKKLIGPLDAYVFLFLK